MAVLDSLTLLINGNAAGFSKANKQVKSELGSLSGAIGSASKILGVLGATLSVGFAVNTLKNLTMQGINLADELDQISQQTNISVSSLSTLRNVCKYADTDFN